MNVDRIVIWGCGLLLVALVISDQREAAQELPAVSSASRQATGEDSTPPNKAGQSTAGPVRDSAKQPASSPTYFPCPKLNAARKWLVAEIAQCPDSKPCQVWCEYQDQHLMTRNEVKL